MVKWILIIIAIAMSGCCTGRIREPHYEIGLTATIESKIDVATDTTAKINLEIVRK